MSGGVSTGTPMLRWAGHLIVAGLCVLDRRRGIGDEIAQTAPADGWVQRRQGRTAPVKLESALELKTPAERLTTLGHELVMPASVVTGKRDAGRVRW